MHKKESVVTKTNVLKSFYYGIGLWFLKIPLVILGAIVLDALGVSDIEAYSAINQTAEVTADTFYWVVVFAPAIETLVGQWFPIEFLGKYSQRNWLKILLSGLIFGFMHLPVLEFIIAASAIGFVLAKLWIDEVQVSREQAFFVVTMAHAFHNFFAFMWGFFFP